MEEQIIKNLRELISWKGNNIQIRDYELDAIERFIRLI